MNKKQQTTIGIALVLILACLAAIYLYVGPQYQTLITQRNQLLQDKDAKQKRLQTITDVKAALPQLESSIGLIDSVGLPTGSQLPDLIEQVEQLVLSHSDTFKLVSFEPSLVKDTVKSTGGNPSAPSGTALNLVLEGDPTKLDSFLDGVYKNIRPLYVKSITIAPVSSETAVPDQTNITISMIAVNNTAAAAIAQ